MDVREVSLDEFYITVGKLLQNASRSRHAAPTRNCFGTGISWNVHHDGV